VKEEKPPKGKDAVEWFLAANETVTSPKEAYEYAGYCLQRWKIERFHYVLKRGCGIENLQEHRQNHNIYPDVLNYRGDDTELT
jgi:hypothetical protein